MCGCVAIHCGRVVIVWGCVWVCVQHLLCLGCFFFQAEDGIRDLVRSRGLGDVYKRQVPDEGSAAEFIASAAPDRVDVWNVEGSAHTGGLLSLIHI